MLIKHVNNATLQTYFEIKTDGKSIFPRDLAKSGTIIQIQVYKGVKRQALSSWFKYKGKLAHLQLQ